MRKKLRLCVLLVALLVSGSLASIVYAKERVDVIWTAVFSKGIPINPHVSQLYCDQHTPTTMITTIEEITSQNGVKALNDISVKYLSYHQMEKDNLDFNVVDAMISGQDSTGKTWSTPMKLYEQTLNPVDVTYTVWSTPYCKGTFLGTPTLVKQRALHRTN